MQLLEALRKETDELLALEAKTIDGEVVQKGEPPRNRTISKSHVAAEDIPAA